MKMKIDVKQARLGIIALASLLVVITFSRIFLHFGPGRLWIVACIVASLWLRLDPLVGYLSGLGWLAAASICFLFGNVVLTNTMTVYSFSCFTGGFLIEVERLLLRSIWAAGADQVDQPQNN